MTAGAAPAPAAPAELPARPLQAPPVGGVVQTVPAAPAELPARPLLAQSWAQLTRMGAITAGTQAFIALSGMPIGLDRRMIVSPVLSLGYLSLLWLPVVVGHRLGHQKELEGVPRHAAGWHEIFGGALVGAISGSGLSVLSMMIAQFDLRDPLVNWGPQLAGQLNFDRGTAFGAMAWPVVGAVLGAAGGGLRLPRKRVRLVTVTAAVAVAAASVLELLVSDLMEGIGGKVIVDWLYAKRGGLTPAGAIVLGAVSGAAALLGRGRLGRARDRLHRLEGAERTRANAALIVSTGVLLTVMPLLVGRLTNELLANVGLFVLLALGLNIVVGLTGILDLGYVAFFAVGGYTTAILTAASSPKFAPELPWFAALLAVIAVAGLTGLFIGAPVIRMRGDYLAIVTLGFGRDHPSAVPVGLAVGMVRGRPGHHQHRRCRGVRPGHGVGRGPPQRVLPGAGVLCSGRVRVVAAGALPHRAGLDGGARGRDRGPGDGRQHRER